MQTQLIYWSTVGTAVFLSSTSDRLQQCSSVQASAQGLLQGKDPEKESSTENATGKRGATADYQTHHFSHAHSSHRTPRGTCIFLLLSMILLPFCRSRSTVWVSLSSFPFRWSYFTKMQWSISPSFLIFCQSSCLIAWMDARICIIRRASEPWSDVLHKVLCYHVKHRRHSLFTLFTPAQAMHDDASHRQH